MTENDRLLCPSSKCEEGAILLGIVMPDGRVAFASDRIEINAEFVRSAREGRPPEKRFRFSGPCVQSGCRQWDGNRCTVIDVVLQEAKQTKIPELPDCSIRSQCRWYSQRGSSACFVCPEVVTDMKVDAGSPVREPSL